MKALIYALMMMALLALSGCILVPWGGHEGGRHGGDDGDHGGGGHGGGGESHESHR